MSEWTTPGLERREGAAIVRTREGYTEYQYRGERLAIVIPSRSGRYPPAIVRLLDKPQRQDREAGMCEFYGAIRGLIADIDTVSKRAWLQPIGADYFVELCFPPDLDPATVFPKYVEVMGTVTKDANGRVVRVLAEQCRNHAPKPLQILIPPKVNNVEGAKPEWVTVDETHNWSPRAS